MPNGRHISRTTARRVSVGAARARGLVLLLLMGP